jgi:LmbE family N-acetylglucosaminyl deacetylase
MFLVLLLTSAVLASAAPPGRTLLIVAHPDDEYYFSATVYRMAVQLHGQVDELIITDGEGGFRYSTLAEPFYKRSLTTEAEGRKELPAIRKRETLNAGRILGIKDHYFLNQKDQGFTTDPEEGVRRSWDLVAVKDKIKKLIQKRHYEYVFTVLPRATAHGHHQAATALAAVVIHAMPAASRPTMLGFDTDATPFDPQQPSQEGQSWDPAYVYAFDRTVKFGYHESLNYQVIVNWMIAEHKSQGLFQTLCDKDPKEYIWVNRDSDSRAEDSAQALFRAIDIPPQHRAGSQ